MAVRIKNADIIFDFNNINGIGMILNFDYKNEEGKEKKFIKRLNKIVDIDENGNLAVKKTNVQKAVRNFYYYTPDLIFLESHDANFFNELKPVFEKENKKGVYTLKDTERMENFIIDDVNLNLTVEREITQKEAKESLKAYETPDKTFKFIANILDRAVKELFIKETALKTTNAGAKQNFNSVSVLDIDYAMEEKRLKRLLNKEISLKDIENGMDKESFEKNRKYYEFLLKIPDKNIFKFLKSNEKELRKLKLSRILDIKPHFLDYQAGSGKILNSLKEKGVNAVLLGTELRNTENPPEGYEVINGVNFMLVNETIKSIQEDGKRKKMFNSVINYSNPPYTTDDLVGKKSIDTIKPGSIVFGLYPVKMEKYLSSRIDGIIYKVPREATGYTDKNAPQEFLFIVGKKLNGDTTKDIEMHIQQSRSETVSVLTDNLNTLKIPDDIISDLAESLSYSINADYSRMIYDFKSKIKNTLERYKNIQQFQSVIAENKNKILSSFLPSEALKKDEVFPDIRFFDKNGYVKKYTFYDTVNNLPLLMAYKKQSPQFFKIIKNIADETGIKMPDIEEDGFVYSFTNTKPLKKDFITNKNLGMMKLKYYPDYIDISDEKNKSILLDLLNKYYEKKGIKPSDEDLNTIEILTNMSKALVLKNEKETDNSLVYSNEVLVFINQFGQDLGKFNIKPDDFYDLLKEEGYFNLNDFVELKELEDNQYEKLTEKFIEYMNHVKESVIDFNIVNYKEFYNDKEKNIILKEFNEELVQNYKQFRNYMKKSEKEKAVKTVLDFANKYHLKEIYEHYFIMPNSETLVKKALNRYSKALDKKLIQEINEIIKEHYTGREVTFFETERIAFFTRLNEKYGLDKKIDFEKFVLDIEDALTPAYQTKKQIYTGYVNLAKIMLTGVAPLENLFYIYKNTDNKDLKEKYFDKTKETFKLFFTKKLGLKLHQFEEAVRYAALNDTKKLEMLFWEMRAGKTRAMLGIGFLNMLKTGDNLDLIVETANMNDITMQILESYPFMLLHSNFFVGDNSKISVNNGNVYSMLATDEIIPNLPKILQPYLVGKGKKVEELSKTFYSDIKEIMNKMDEENISVYEKKLKESPFGECIKGLCKK